MAFLQFEEIQDVVVMDNGDDPICCEFSFSNNGELESVYFLFYMQGQPSGNVRINLLSDLTQVSPIASTNWVDIADIRSDTTNRISWVRFDFNRLPVSSSGVYYFQIETSGYTRNGETDYLSFCQQQVQTPNLNSGGVAWARTSKPAEFLIYQRL